MDLKPINLQRIKNFPQVEKDQTIAEYEKEKRTLIEEYLRVQEIVDQYNEQIYHLTCKIEQINLALHELRNDSNSKIH